MRFFIIKYQNIAIAIGYRYIHRYIHRYIAIAYPYIRPATSSLY